MKTLFGWTDSFHPVHGVAELKEHLPDEEREQARAEQARLGGGGAISEGEQLARRARPDDQGEPARGVVA